MSLSADLARWAFATQAHRIGPDGHLVLLPGSAAALVAALHEAAERARLLEAQPVPPHLSAAELPANVVRLPARPRLAPAQGGAA